MTDRYRTLMNRIHAGEHVMIDGGTGSEMSRRGIPVVAEAWTGGAALSHPDIVRDVHSDYIAAGASVIISNTFATHRSVLRDAGVEVDFEALNRRAVELAVEARNTSGRPETVVAGSMSHWSFTGHDPNLDELQSAAMEQAAILAAAGAEFLVLEMMIEIDRMTRMVRAGRATGLPVWVGLTVGSEGGRTRTPGVMTLREGEELLADAIATLDPDDVDLLAIMHTDVELIDPCLDIVFDVWTGPIGVYAHSGADVDGELVFDDAITPADYASYCRSWLDRGVHVVGGCCGTRPDHMAAVSRIPGLA